jgi:hypothetical protein
MVRWKFSSPTGARPHYALLLKKLENCVMTERTSPEIAENRLPLQYEDGTDYCTVKDAQGRDFALTVQPEMMKAMERALREDIDRLVRDPARPVAWVIRWNMKQSGPQASAYIKEHDARSAAVNVARYAHATDVVVMPVYAALSAPAQKSPDRNKLAEFYDSELARVTGLYFDALKEISALKASISSTDREMPKGPAGDQGQVGWMGGEFDR